MPVTSNCGGKVIRKLMVFESVYHCVVQDYYGKIYHVRFNSKEKALDYMEQFHDSKVKAEYIR